MRKERAREREREKEERVIKNGGKGRDRSWVMGDEIETTTSMRSVLGGSVFGGDAI